MSAFVYGWLFFVTEDDNVASKIAPGSRGTVLPYVAISCLGAILFGYHLGYVVL